MSFVSGLMGLGALAFVVPLAIHLLFRSRFRTLDWGAMFLLQGVVQANRRRMRWHQWILLLLRCAIPVLLALAMARPLITGFQSIPGDTPMSLVLVIDDSRSIQAGGRTDRLLRGTGELLDCLSRSDEVLLLRTSRINQTPAADSPRGAADRLREIRFEAGPVDWSSVLARSIETCQLASHVHRRIVVASDFQNINDASISFDAVLAKRSQIDPPPAIDWFNVADGDSSLNNLVVESVESQSPATIVGQPVQVTAAIQNDGDVPIVKAVGRWIVGDQTVATQTIDLPQRGGVTINHEFPAFAIGSHALGFAVEHNDALAADNRREIAIEVLPPVRVVLVDGQPSAVPLRGEVDFLRIALSPFAFGPATSESRDMVTTTVIAPSNVAATLLDEPTKPDILVIANVAKLNDAKSAIADYISDGGSVVFFDGDQTNATAWADCDWLPAMPTTMIAAPDSPQWSGSRWAAWYDLDRNGPSPLSDVKFESVRRLTPREGSIVVLRFADGSPLLVRRSPSGTRAGQVFQFAVSCDTAMSNWPLRPSFLPLMQSMILNLRQNRQQLNVAPGQPLQLMVPKPNSPAILLGPDGVEHRLNVDPTGWATFEQTFIPGAYQLKNSGASDGLSSPNAMAVVSVPASESNLSIVDSSELGKLARRGGASIRLDAASLIAASQTDRNGREVWRWAMIAMLMVMVAEVFWQQSLNHAFPAQKEPMLAKTR